MATTSLMSVVAAIANLNIMKEVLVMIESATEIDLGAGVAEEEDRRAQPAPTAETRATRPGDVPSRSTSVLHAFTQCLSVTFDKTCVRLRC